jgi:hypothetical protein
MSKFTDGIYGDNMNLRPPYLSQRTYPISGNSAIPQIDESFVSKSSLVPTFSTSVFSSNPLNLNTGSDMHRLQSIMMSEEIKEYNIMIDSKDRNYQVYPSPFSYTVNFNPLPRSVSNGVVFETPSPTINQSINNVRYIKLESVIFPFFNKVRPIVDVDEYGVEFSRLQINTRLPLSDNLYNVISIGEYTDTLYKSTNDVLSNSFAALYFHKKVSPTHFWAHPSGGVKIFSLDNLGRVDKFTISFMDPYGQPLDVKHLDKKIKSNMICDCHDPEGDDDTDCFMHNLSHPLNPHFQHHLFFRIGVIEPRLVKKSSY